MQSPGSAIGLTPTQQGMLFHHMSVPHSGVDVEQIVCTLPESVDVELLRKAWSLVIEANPALRARFTWASSGEPEQRFDAPATPEILLEDLQGDADTVAGEVAQRLTAERQRGLDLATGPAMRISLLRAGPARSYVIWTFHHIICDGRSFPLVLDQVFEAYGCLQGGRTWTAPARPDFADHVRLTADQDLAAAEAFWKARLAGFGTPTALPGRPHDGAATGRGHAEVTLPRESSEAIRQAAELAGVSPNTLVQAAWALLLARWSGESDVVFGATRSGRASSVAGADAIVGCLINTLPVRVTFDDAMTVRDCLGALRERERAVRPFEQTPLMDLQRWAGVTAGRALFDSLVVFDYQSLDAQMKALGPAHAERQFRLVEQTNYPLTLYVYAEARIILRLAYDEPRFDAGLAGRLLAGFVHVLGQLAAQPDTTLGAIALITDAERARLVNEWNATATAYTDTLCIHQAIEAVAARMPEAAALLHRDTALTYDALNRRANRLAFHLLGLGVGPGVPVAVCAERCPELVVALLAIHKAGGCYLPLDPAYPRDRLAYMLSDSGAPVLVTQSRLLAALPEHQGDLVLLDDESMFAGKPERNPVGAAKPTDLAYVIYTSGSTGRPKGVMIEHRNVLNFFAGMDQCLRPQPDATGCPGTWLAVTSLSFDISVLEIFWTLARGFRVVLHEDQQRAAARGTRARSHDARPIDFSLMYFSSAATAGADKYRLLIEGAKFADTNGFSAVWTPERHFHDFGGLYPNPAVTSAALAQATQRIALRAGSVVAPLHHPARIAEEWALVDNLSNGRIGIAFASGWQPRDFVLAPDAFADPRSAMAQAIDQVRRLWRGEAVNMPGPGGAAFEVRTSPRPVQPELPFWLTAAGSPETFRAAGAMGAAVLTHLLGQTVEELQGKLATYREAWRSAGHAGDGHVTLMLHTFVGDDTAEVKERVRPPMMNYLGSSLGLVKGFASTWTAFKKRSDGSTSVDIDMDSLTPEEMEGLLEYSFERYFETSGLFGDVERALDIVDRIKGLGVDEIACLIDFGVDEDVTLAHLAHLNRVRELAAPVVAAVTDADGSIAAQIRQFGVTHLQCTPSLASMLVQDDVARGALGTLRLMLVGGEALPASLAQELRGAGVERLLNMYGPTETTIWSAVHEVGDETEAIPIGRPIANTQLYVVDPRMQPVPAGVPGELCIGGHGVVRGYLGRPELTAERFVPDTIGGDGAARLYRTGDLARWREDGVLEFLGRIDHQVKIRGHRIELGEIEAALNEHDAVREAVVIAREDTPGDVRLVGYLIAADSAAAPAGKALRDYLRERLPEAMVPSAFVVLESFPQTPNRKIDRKALPAPVLASGAAVGREASSVGAPTNEIERLILGVWQEVLNVTQVGLDENFFDLGGHSLLAVKTHRRLVEVLPKPIGITDLFRFPTVRMLAEYLADGDTGESLQQSQARGASRRDALSARRASRMDRRARSGGQDESQQAPE